MSSRKEQKERLRGERLAKEAEAKAAERRRRMVGYGAAGVIGVAAVAIVVILVASGGGGGGEAHGDADFPKGSVPDQKRTDLKKAAAAAGCELKSFRGTGRDHIQDLSQAVKYNSNPPSSGNHYEVPAEDGAYTESPDPKELVHSLEHGRVIIWFKPSASAKTRGDLKAMFDEDSYHMILTPNTTHMKYEVAATAWSADPEPLGTGQLLGCPKMNEKVFDAIRTFREEHRDNGPETVP